MYDGEVVNADGMPIEKTLRLNVQKNQIVEVTGGVPAVDWNNGLLVGSRL